MEITNEQINILLERQLNPISHAYTCTCGLILYPTKNGWICGVCGKYQKYGALELGLIKNNMGDE